MSEDEQAWRSSPVDRREREHSPSRCVDALVPLLAAYAARSREAEQRFLCRKNLRWGEAADEAFDFFPAARADAPLLLFIHGGYWQELSKNESLFAAPGCVTNGVAYAALNYTLAPKARLDRIVKQCRRAVAYFHREARTLGFDARPLYVAGSSAGAHLAAMLLVRGWQGPVGLAALIELDSASSHQPNHVRVLGSFGFLLLLCPTREAGFPGDLTSLLSRKGSRACVAAFLGSQFR